MLEQSLHQWCFLLRASSMMPDIKTFFWPWKISMMNEKQLWNVEKVRQWWVVVDFYWVFQYLWNLQVCFKRFMTGSKLSGQFWLSSMYSASWSHIFNFCYTNTHRSQIEGYTRLLIFRKLSILPAVIWASPFINIQEKFQPFCFFTYDVIRAYPLINLDKDSSLPVY